VTGLHNDDEQNVLMQLAGSKHVLLYPPRDGPLLYMNDRYDKGTVCCSADPLAPDAMQRWPLLRQATRWEVTLQPGEQLFIPRYWWHRVACVSESVSVNAFGSTALELVREGAVRSVMDLAHQLGWWRGNCVCCDDESGVATLKR